MDRNTPEQQSNDRHTNSHRSATSSSHETTLSDSGFSTRDVLNRNTTDSTFSTVYTTGSSSVYSTNHDADSDVDESNPIRETVSPLGNKTYPNAQVTHIDHPSAFFLTLSQFAEGYPELDEKLNDYYQSNPSNKSSWKRGEYCAAKYYKDGRFYRARIIEIPEVTGTTNQYDVVFVDFGNWDKVPVGDIHQLAKQFTNLRAQAVPCSLHRTAPLGGNWFDHPQAIRLFQNLVVGKMVTATFRLKTSKDSWPLSYVELVLAESEMDVRSVLIDRNLAVECDNEKLYSKLQPYMKHVDYLIYSIANEQNDDSDN